MLNQGVHSIGFTKGNVEWFICGPGYLKDYEIMKLLLAVSWPTDPFAVHKIYHIVYETIPTQWNFTALC